MRLQTRHDGGAGGFTMLEVMVCLTIITVAIGAFLTAVARNVQLEATTSETNAAVNAAKAVVETVQGLTYAELDHTTVSSTFEATGLANDGHVLHLTDVSGSTQVGHVTITEDVEGSCKTVQVEVVWRSITGSNRRVLLMTELRNH